MEQDTQRTNPVFNVASEAAFPPPTADNTMALIVDVGVGNLSDKDADDYLNNLGRSLRALREAGIPVVWVTMSDRNHLHPPGQTQGQGVSQVEGNDFSRLTEMRIGPGEMHSDFKNERFRRFLREDGPKTNEAVYEKKCESAFVETEDYAGDEDKTKLLAGHLPRDPKTKEEIRVEGDTGGLTQYAKDNGAKHVLVLGAMSTHCDTETAVGGLQKGFNPWICLDNVLSWTKPEDEVQRPTPASRAVWHGEGAGDDYHRAKISARLDDIAANETEKKLRGLSDGDIDTVRDNFTTVQGFIGAMSRRATAPRPGQQPALTV